MFKYKLNNHTERISRTFQNIGSLISICYAYYWLKCRTKTVLITYIPGTHYNMISHLLSYRKIKSMVKFKLHFWKEKASRSHAPKRWCYPGDYFYLVNSEKLRKIIINQKNYQSKHKHFVWWKNREWFSGQFYSIYLKKLKRKQQSISRFQELVEVY